MFKTLCAFLNHPKKFDTGNKIDGKPVIRCNNCDRAWFGNDEIMPMPKAPFDNPWR